MGRKNAAQRLWPAFFHVVLTEKEGLWKRGERDSPTSTTVHRGLTGMLCKDAVIEAEG